MKMSNYPAKYDVLIKQYLCSILDTCISVLAKWEQTRQHFVALRFPLSTKLSSIHFDEHFTGK